MSLSIFEPTVDRRINGRQKVDVTTLVVGSRNAHLGIQHWTDAPGRKLESQLPEIVEQLLRRAELAWRARMLEHYQDRVAQHERELAEQEAQRQAAEAKRLADVEAKRQQLCQEVMAHAQRRRMAEDIRATVEALKAHPDAQSLASKKFQAWRAHALEVADSLDPLLGPMEPVVGPFNAP